jgi:hypothetical protein
MTELCGRARHSSEIDSDSIESCGRSALPSVENTVGAPQIHAASSKAEQECKDS